MRLKCRRALFDIVDQAAFTSVKIVHIAKLESLIGKAQSLGQELSDNLKTTKEHASSEAHDSDSRIDLLLVEETVPRVSRSISARIAYLQHQQRITSAKKSTEKLRRDTMPSSDEVRSANPSARSPVANDPLRSPELSARSPDADKPVRTAEPSARSRVASDSVRSVDNAVLNPHATVFRHHAGNVACSTVTSDFPDISDATYEVRTSQGNATRIDVSDLKTVNVSTPLEVIAASNFHPTLANTPAQADVIALQTRSDTQNKTFSGEYGQA